MPAEDYLTYCLNAGKWTARKYADLNAAYIKQALEKLLESPLLKGRLKPGERQYLAAQCDETPAGGPPFPSRMKALEVFGFSTKVTASPHFHYYNLAAADAIQAAAKDMHRMVQIAPEAVLPSKVHFSFELMGVSAISAEREFLAELARQIGVEIDATTPGLWRVKDSPARPLKHD